MPSWDELRKDAHAFGASAEEITSSFIENLNEIPVAPVVYHYTDQSGLHGIIESGSLRLTDLFYLNDPSELRHGVDYALGLLAKRTKSTLPEIRLFLDKFIATFRRDLHEAAEFFVCCFSSTGDNLDQWRAYADNGRGYALGFDGPKLIDTFDSGDSGRSSFPIIYSLRRIQRPFSQMIDDLVPLICAPRGISATNSDIDDYMGELSAMLTLNLITLSMLLKHPAYRHEHEHRLLQMFALGSTIKDLQHRVSHGALARYITFDWKTHSPGLLRTIVIGPAADANAARRFATDCCRAFLRSPDDVEIRQSKLPYRP